MDYVFYGITMKTRNNKTLYLKCSSRESKNPYKVLFDWTFDKSEACLWEADHECEKFAKEYFRNFSGYKITQMNIDANSLKVYNTGEVSV